jgi:rubrerythrin
MVLGIDHAPSGVDTMTKSILNASAVAVLLGAALAVSTAGAGSTKVQPSTATNLSAAMHGEAFAHLKYMKYAEHARANGNEELAKLFEENARIEADEHFAREADALVLAAADDVNLLDAMAGEKYENTKMYQDFARQAEAAGDKKVAAMFRQIASDEADHYESYKDALAKLRTAKSQ